MADSKPKTYFDKQTGAHFTASDEALEGLSAGSYAPATDASRAAARESGRTGKAFSLEDDLLGDKAAGSAKK